MSERTVPCVIQQLITNYFHVPAAHEGITVSSDQSIEVLLSCKRDGGMVAQSLHFFF